MEILSKTSDGLRRCYNIFLDKKAVEEAVAKEIENKAQKIRLDGFRPGKAPLDVVKRIYGDSARREAINSLISTTADSVVADEQLKICIGYKTDIIKENDDGVEFTMKFELMPHVELKDFSFIEITKYQAEITDNEVMSFLEEIIARNKKWEEEAASEEIKIGHKVIIDLLLKTPIKKHKSSTIRGLDLIVGDDNILSDFWTPLLGLKASESKEFTVNYPANIDDKNLAGKPVVYSAVVKKVFKSSNHEMNDEFAQYIGHNNLNETIDWARSRITAKYEAMSKDIIHRNLLEILSDMYNDLEIPKNMLEFEYRDVLNQIVEEVRRMGKEVTPEILEESRKLAGRRVRVGFVIAEIAQKEKITVTHEEISKAIDNIAKLHPGKERVIYDAYSREGRSRILIGPILETKVINKLSEEVKIVEKKCTVQELIAIDEEPFDFLINDETKAKEESGKVDAPEAKPGKKGKIAEKSGHNATGSATATENIDDREAETNNKGEGEDADDAEKKVEAKKTSASKSKSEKSKPPTETTAEGKNKV